MIVKISRTARRILLSIDIQKYSELVNEIYRLPDPLLALMREREQEAATAVKKLVGRYFPKILEDYDVYLTLKDWEFNKELYFLTLRKKKENRTRKEFE